MNGKNSFTDYNDSTPVLAACENGDEKILSYLLEYVSPFSSIFFFILQIFAHSFKIVLLIFPVFYFFPQILY